VAEPISVMAERRRLERRTNARVADLTLPELRRMMVTSMLFVIIVVLFLWMVRTVIIAGILGVIVASFLRPVHLRLVRRLGKPAAAATLTLLLVIVPAAALSVYSYAEVAEKADYIRAHQTEIAAKVDSSVRHLPFVSKSASTGETIRESVLAGAASGTRVVAGLRAAMRSIAVAATIFLFTAFYVLIDADRILEYLRGRVPPRYSELSDALETNVRGVLYGAIYSTFVTQILKSVIIFVMNIVFGVPLAGVLAILSFIIGFFPIVGSWSVYVPVAAWLLIFQNSPAKAIAMATIGFTVNTLYISTFLRPKLAAERSKVLNFYWMLVGLITGVYTFGLVGILLGPMLIGLLKAILDTITSQPAWQFEDRGGDAGGPSASPV
jgi:predicted PurR-regulated permease PerM